MNMKKSVLINLQFVKDVDMKFQILIMKNILKIVNI